MVLEYLHLVYICMHLVENWRHFSLLACFLIDLPPLLLFIDFAGIQNEAVMDVILSIHVLGSLVNHDSGFLGYLLAIQYLQ